MCFIYTRRDYGQNCFNINAITEIKIKVNMWIGGLAAGQNAIDARTDLDMDGMFIDWTICAGDQYQSRCRPILFIQYTHRALLFVFPFPNFHSSMSWMPTHKQGRGCVPFFTIDFVNHKHLEAEVIFTARRMSWPFLIAFIFRSTRIIKFISRNMFLCLFFYVQQYHLWIKEKKRMHRLPYVSLNVCLCIWVSV